MVSFGGSAFFARREGSSFSDSNGYTGNVSLSTYWTQRFSTNVGYSYTRIDYIKSIGDTNIQSAVSYTHLGKEGDVFRAVLKHSIALALLIGLIVMFFAYAAPGWVPNGHKWW